MHWCHEAYGVNFAALRYFNVAGAKENGIIGEDHRPETHLIPIVLQVALGQRDELTVLVMIMIRKMALAYEIIYMSLI